MIINVGSRVRTAGDVVIRDGIEGTVLSIAYNPHNDATFAVVETNHSKIRFDVPFDKLVLVDTVSLDKRRREVAEAWYQQSDLNGDQVVDARGWENAVGRPDSLSRTLFVESDSGEGPSIRKTLRVVFGPNDADIVAAYLPGSSNPDDDPGIEVDGSANWRMPEEEPEPDTRQHDESMDALVGFQTDHPSPFSSQNMGDEFGDWRGDEDIRDFTD